MPENYGPQATPRPKRKRRPIYRGTNRPLLRRKAGKPRPLRYTPGERSERWTRY